MNKIKEFITEVHNIAIQNIYDYIFEAFNRISNELVKDIVAKIKEIKYTTESDEIKSVKKKLVENYGITGWMKDDLLVDKLEFYIFRSEIRRKGDNLEIEIFIPDENKFLDLMDGIITKKWLDNELKKLINKYIQI